MKILTLAACVAMFLAGCASGGSRSSGSTANGVTMESGQWEFVVVPENGTIPMFIDVNLPGTNGEVTGTIAKFFSPRRTTFQANRAQCTAATSTWMEASAVAP